LRLIAGFERPDHGDILIDGRSVVDSPPNLRPVNLVFQQYALFPHLTVAGNVAFGLEMRGIARTEIRARVGATLEMVQLAGKGDRLPAQLSGGEQQRVALARALVNRPAVLLLDEPLGALDRQLRLEMQGELKAIQERVGSTFICVTHHQEEALAMSDRVAVLHQGCIQQVGRPQDIYDAPASLFVAEFVGLSNRLEGRIAVVEGTRCCIETPGLPTIQANRPPGVGSGGAVSVVLRPERLRLSRPAAANGFDNVVAAQVTKRPITGMRCSTSCGWPSTCSGRSGCRTPTAGSRGSCRARPCWYAGIAAKAWCSRGDGAPRAAVRRSGGLVAACAGARVAGPLLCAPPPRRVPRQLRFAEDLRWRRMDVHAGQLS